MSWRLQKSKEISCVWPSPSSSFSTILTILAKTIYTKDKVVVDKVLRSVWFDDLEEIGGKKKESNH